MLLLNVVYFGLIILTLTAVKRKVHTPDKPTTMILAVCCGYSRPLKSSHAQFFFALDW